jgi:hypothetical protein
MPARGRRMLRPVLKMVAISMQFVLCAFAPAIVVACPTCKESLHDDGAAGFAISIGLLLGMPILLLATWGIALYRLAVVANQRRPTTSNQSLTASKAAAYAAE